MRRWVQHRGGGERLRMRGYKVWVVFYHMLIVIQAAKKE